MFPGPYAFKDSLGKTVNEYKRVVSLKKAINDEAFRSYERNGMLPDKYYPHRRPDRLHGHILNFFIRDKKTGKSQINDVGLNFLKDNIDSYIAAGRAPECLKIHDAGAAINYLTYSNIALQSMIESIFYAKYRVPQWFPIKTDIPEGSEAYQTRIVDTFGRARFIDNYGTNAATADISMTSMAYPLRRGAIDIKYANRELQQATLDGIPFTGKLNEAATNGCLTHMEQVALGTATDGFIKGGLLNHVDIPIATELTPWNLLPDAATVTQRIDQYIAGIMDSTNQIFSDTIDTPLALYGSIRLLAFLNTQITLNGVGTGQSIWDYVRTKNTWTIQTGKPLEYIIVREMKDAAVGDNDRVLFGYPTADEVWEMGASISVPRVERVIADVYGYRSGMIYEISGLNVKRPGGLLYVDNVYDASQANLAYMTDNNGNQINDNDGNPIVNNVIA